MEPMLEPKEVRDNEAGQGFLEVNGEITKTSHGKSKRRRTTPMVAHSWGLTTDAWGPTWLKIRQQNGWRAEEDETIMVGCGPDLELQKGTYMTTDAMAMV